MSTTTEQSPTGVAPPPESFNFAQHLLAVNAGRAAKTAFIDDAGTLTYGELADRARRLAAGLRALGIKREERVLLLMQDVNDWPVAFLGAMYAGAVPVAVNTLLTADDYAYMLEHSRAQAALVSGALLPALKAALDQERSRGAARSIVSRPVAPLDFGEVEFGAFIAAHAPLARPRPIRMPTIPRSGSIRRARPAAPRAPCIRTPIRIGPPSSTARASCSCASPTSASRRPSSSSPMASATR